MNVIFQRGRATVSEVHESLPDAPSYSAVRALLGILEAKGHLHHVQEGVRYVYFPTQARGRAARFALAQVVQTFFGGSVERAVATLISESEAHLSTEELTRLADLIEQAKQEERRP